MKNITAKDLFFCYNKQVAKFLRYEKILNLLQKHIQK